MCFTKYLRDKQLKSCDSSLPSIVWHFSSPWEGTTYVYPCPTISFVFVCFYFDIFQNICKVWQPPVYYRLNFGLSYCMSLGVERLFLSLGIMKEPNLWVKLCNQWLPRVLCVACFLGEEEILTGYHGTPSVVILKHGSKVVMVPQFSGSGLLGLLDSLCLSLSNTFTYAW